MRKKEVSQIAELKKLLAKERDEFGERETQLLSRCVIEHAHAKQVIDWIKNGTKPAVTAFTEGPDRQIAYAVESDRIHQCAELITQQVRRIETDCFEEAAIAYHRAVVDYLGMSKEQRTYGWHDVEDALTEADKVVRALQEKP